MSGAALRCSEGVCDDASGRKSLTDDYYAIVQPAAPESAGLICHPASIHACFSVNTYSSGTCRAYARMSGIVSLLYADGRPVEELLLRRMIGTLRHRGRGEDLLRLRDGVGLALRGGQMPQEGAAGRRGDGLWLVADARIDNRDRLPEMLGIGRDGEYSDAELILCAYERWGSECAAKLIGDFAFVLHDPVRGEMLCARDGAGVRPLYYHHASDHDGGFFAVASEIKALLAHPAIPGDVDATRVGDYLAGLFDDKEITFYRAVRRLPPGHTLVVGRSGVRLFRHASLDTGRELPSGSADHYADAFGELFTDAVRCRLYRSGPVGAALSGGLDSSSVAAVARDLLAAGGRSPLHTFSALYARPEADEHRYMESVVAGGGIIPHYIMADTLGPLEEIGQMLAHLDEPFFSPNLYIHWRLFREASASGCRVWLDGLDGDTTVSHGIGLLAELARSGRFGSLGRELRALAGRTGVAPGRLFRRTVVNPLLLYPIRRTLHRLNGTASRPWGDGAIVRDDVARRLGLAERFNASIGELAPAVTLRQEHARRLDWGLHAFILETLDKSAARFGLEPRYPFYDSRLVDFCLALPPQQKLHDGWTRAVLRNAMRGILPDAVRLRTTKGDPSASFFTALRRDGGDIISAVAEDGSGALAEYIDMKKFAAIAVRFLRGDGGSQETMELWKGLTLGLWLQQRAAG